MRAGWFILSVLLAVASVAASLHAQSVGAAIGASVEADGSAAQGNTQQRMAELAHRLAGDDASSTAPDPTDATADAPAGLADVAVSPVERTPLGRPGDTPRRTTAGGNGNSNDNTKATPPSSTGTGGWMLSTLAALGVVIGLIFLFRFAYTKVSGTPMVAATSAVEVLSRTSVAPRSHVLMLRVGGRILVVGESSGGLRTLSELDDEQEVAQLLQAIESSRPQSITGGFNALLGRFNRDFDDPAQALADAEGLDDSEHHVDRARDSVSALADRLRRRSQKGGVA